ncbi:MAG: DUF748 domain-containing protein [Deltaproteobacteria bacterium]|nr:DUF748 domain-containing protein [Deltaproteobacteria bacterium]
MKTKNIIKILVVIVALKLLLNIVLTFLIPGIIASKTGIPTKALFVNLNILPGSMSIYGLKFGNQNPKAGTRAISIGKFYVNVSILSLLSSQYIIQKILVNKPIIHLEVTQNQKIPALAWKKNVLAKKKAAQDKAHIPLLIRNIIVRHGRIQLDDHSLTQQPALLVSKINFSLDEIDFINPKMAALELTALIFDKGTVEIKGNADLGKPKISAKLLPVIQNVDLIRFSPYCERYTAVKIQSGLFNMDSQVNIKENYLDSSHHVLATNVEAKPLSGAEAKNTSVLGNVLAIFYQIPALASEKKEKNFDFTFYVKGFITDPNFDFSGLMAQEMTSTIQKIWGVLKHIPTPIGVIEDLGNILGL